MMKKLTISEIKDNLKDGYGEFTSEFKMSELGINNDGSGILEIERLELLSKNNLMDMWFDFNEDYLKFSILD